MSVTFENFDIFNLNGVSGVSEDCLDGVLSVFGGVSGEFFDFD